MKENQKCSLSDRECKPCRGGIPPLAGEHLQKLSCALGPEWTVVDNHHLTKTFEWPDFKTALAFTNRVGELAESIGHHPDIALAWGKTTITLWTHKIGGLAEADFVMAAKIDALDRPA